MAVPQQVYVRTDPSPGAVYGAPEIKDAIYSYFTNHGTSSSVIPSGGTTITTPTSSTANVSNVDSTPLPANASRVYALIINNSDTAIFLALGATAVVGQGILLNPGGGTYEISGNNLYKGAIHAITSVVGPKVLMITEGV